MNDTVLPHRKEDAVVDAIKQFNQSHNISVEIAVVYGSHIRGTSTRKSDVKIRAVHVQDNLAEYVKHSNANEVMTEHYEKEIDVSGSDEEISTVSIEVESWDVKKFTELLLNSNHQAVEVIQTEEVLIDHPSRDELREHIIEDGNVDLHLLYDSFVKQAKSDYETYISEHLVSSTDTIYPIKEKTTDGYIVNPPSGTEDEFYIPEYAVDLHKNRSVKEPINIPYNVTTTSTGNEELVERHFRTTLTEQTVKRNVSVIELCLKARFIANMKSIPSINIRDISSKITNGKLKEMIELENDEFTVDQSINTINSLINESEDKYKVVGDIVKDKNVLPPNKQEDLPTETPDVNMIDNAIEKIVTAAQ